GLRTLRIFPPLRHGVGGRAVLVREELRAGLSLQVRRRGEVGAPVVRLVTDLDPAGWGVKGPILPSPREHSISTQVRIGPRHGCCGRLISWRMREEEQPGGDNSAGARAALPKIGDLLVGKYRIEKVVGEGGMGVVFAARHEALDQLVAV